ncbi:MAG: ImmA/IrrE family metallo-endopeptidase [Lachnospiraceae bacterium]|nr:ImmA/IrrE family metallo-endopeptidase [Lachnospiraceae bacterium]
MIYENLLKESDSLNLITKEKELPVNKGRLKGKRIAIRKDLSNIEKGCVLAEELGHYHTTVGNILDQSSASNRKQELRAKVWAYNKLIGLTGIISSYEYGCDSIHDTAEFLDVTEEFLSDALQYYKSKFGIYTIVDNYIIYFEPSIGVFELI